MTKYFITATDTDAGKTLAASTILFKLGKQFSTAAFKPISAGCNVVDGQLVNEDAALLKKYANSNQSLQSINPIAYEQPIAPHIAANQLGEVISIDRLKNHFNNKIPRADFVITEGAGGWRLPLGEGKYLSEFAQTTQQQIILVINMKLGCLNHAVLTYQSVLSDGLKIAGWIANGFNEMDYLNENIEELTNIIKAPCLGVIPKVDSIENAAQFISIDSLIENKF